MYSPPKTDFASCWQSALQAGDVIIYHWPFDAWYRPLDDAIPCLVLDVQHADGVPQATVIPGFTRKLTGYPTYNITVETRRELRKAGLLEKTTFIGSLRDHTRLDTVSFEYTDGGSPVIGRLSGASHMRLQIVRAALFADAGGSD